VLTGWQAGGGSCEYKVSAHENDMWRPSPTHDHLPLVPQISLVEGVFTVGIAIICIFILPDVPQKARLLTSQEKDRLVYRLQMDRGQVDNSSEISAWKGFMMAVTDPKTWLLCGILTST
jgi:hypothetical protein